MGTERNELQKRVEKDGTRVAIVAIGIIILVLIITLFVRVKDKQQRQINSLQSQVQEQHFEIVQNDLDKLALDLIYIDQNKGTYYTEAMITAWFNYHNAGNSSNSTKSDSELDFSPTQTRYTWEDFEALSEKLSKDDDLKRVTIYIVESSLEGLETPSNETYQDLEQALKKNNEEPFSSKSSPEPIQLGDDETTEN